MFYHEHRLKTLPPVGTHNYTVTGSVQVQTFTYCKVVYFVYKITVVKCLGEFKECLTSVGQTVSRLKYNKKQ